MIGRARRQSAYEPTRQDWMWYAVVPCTAYAVLDAGAFLLPLRITLSAFIIGASALLLVLIGIHNAWDTVTFLVLTSRERGKEE